MNDYNLDLNSPNSNNSNPSTTDYQSQPAKNRFKGQNAWKNYLKDNPTPAQEYKTNYAESLQKYMNPPDNTVNNNTSSETNTIGQDVGNKQDWNINNNPTNSDQTYANIGNDYSVNIAGVGEGFSNMQGAAAYTALNNNQAKRSASEINGLKRGAQASEQATALVGAKDRAADIYNNMGYTQNYWRRKAEAQQNFYLGDVFQQKAPEFELPDSPSDPMDDDTTKDTLDDFKDQLDDD